VGSIYYEGKFARTFRNKKKNSYESPNAKRSGQCGEATFSYNKYKSSDEIGRILKQQIKNKMESY